MHGAAHRLIAAEREGEVREASARLGMGALFLDLFAGLDEIEPVAIMLFDPRRNRKDIGIEDDVFGRETDPDEQIIGAFADLDLRSFVSAWPTSSNAMTTTAAP